MPDYILRLHFGVDFTKKDGEELWTIMHELGFERTLRVGVFPKDLPVGTYYGYDERDSHILGKALFSDISGKAPLLKHLVVITADILGLDGPPIVDLRGFKRQARKIAKIPMGKLLACPKKSFRDEAAMTVPIRGSVLDAKLYTR